ncbi:acyltransferase [Roseibaca sp. V10]|uniref:Acyltransferase n=1 Tax=Roseinatronobacter domitianus TaxID=2940293 RepID=A0ABT0M4I7_9RHOB|nr:acyltransferase family protein [Roseibaca domitiana]MCL1629209.1 acyltransferase [Roseibaca domitiana]
MHYRPEIDGLRAVAVVPVILFHAGVGALAGGFVGVDVFFVISGYLITSIILRERAEGRFSMWRFWERRARRILPALYVVMLACIPVAWALMLPDQYRDFARSLVAVGLFGSNILFWRESGYFAAAAEEKPLLHTWSLSVEEQFYLLFPLLMVLLWRFGRRGVAGILAVIALVSLGLSHYAAYSMPSANFYLLPTRAWELLVGALCALWLAERPRVGHDGLAGLGLAAIVLSVVWFDGMTPFPSLWALLPVLGAAGVILFARPEGWTGRLLSQRWMVGIGLVSYSAYLWHQPLMAFARIAHLSAPPLWVMLALGALSFPLAYVTWRFVEQPFRRRRGTFARPARLGAALVPTFAVLLAVGVHGHVTEGRRDIWMAQAPEAQVHMYRLLETARAGGAGWRRDPALPCVLQLTRLAGQMDRLRACHETHGPGLLVAGDSHARMLMPVLQGLTKRPFVVTLAQGGCQSFSRRPECTHSQELRTLLREEPALFSDIVYHVVGQSMLTDGTAHAGTPSMFERIGAEDPVVGIAVNQDHIDQVVAFLSELSMFDGPQVLWVGPGLGHYLPMAGLLRAGCDALHSLRAGQAELFSELDEYAALRALARGVPYVSLQKMIQINPSLDLTSCAELFWIDGHHWSVAGMRHFMPRLMPLAAQLKDTSA